LALTLGGAGVSFFPFSFILAKRQNFQTSFELFAHKHEQ
jgi:3-methyladenine DNA glycosylase Tag